MSLIKLEDVQNILEHTDTTTTNNPDESYFVQWKNTMRKETLKSINSLPSIDPQQMIQEMIDDCWNLSDSFNEKMVWTTREKLLQELLNKLQ